MMNDLYIEFNKNGKFQKEPYDLKKIKEFFQEDEDSLFGSIDDGSDEFSDDYKSASIYSKTGIYLKLYKSESSGPQFMYLKPRVSKYPISFESLDDALGHIGAEVEIFRYRNSRK